MIDLSCVQDMRAMLTIGVSLPATTTATLNYSTCAVCPSGGKRTSKMGSICVFVKELLLTLNCKSIFIWKYFNCNWNCRFVVWSLIVRISKWTNLLPLVSSQNSTSTICAHNIRNWVLHPSQKRQDRADFHKVYLARYFTIFTFRPVLKSHDLLLHFKYLLLSLH